MANSVAVTITSVTRPMPKMFSVSAQAVVKDAEQAVLFTANSTQNWKTHWPVAQTGTALLDDLQAQIDKWKAEAALLANQEVIDLAAAIQSNLEVN